MCVLRQGYELIVSPQGKPIVYNFLDNYVHGQGQRVGRCVWAASGEPSAPLCVSLRPRSCWDVQCAACPAVCAAALMEKSDQTHM